MKLGVFDSGIGGLAVAASLRATFTDAEIMTVNDKANVPYGSKTPDQIIVLTTAAIQPLLAAGCDVIILACNTATAAAITTLRARYPDQKFIGIEPMIKAAAAATTTGVIAVCATPATLSSTRYEQLVSTYADTLTLVQPDCSDWAYLIENDAIHRHHITSIVNDVCLQGADVIVLGCTHYHWIKEIIVEIAAGRAIVLEPSEAIGRRVKQLLSSSITAA